MIKIIAKKLIVTIILLSFVFICFSAFVSADEVQVVNFIMERKHWAGDADISFSNGALTLSNSQGGQESTYYLDENKNIKDIVDFETCFIIKTPSGTVSNGAFGFRINAPERNPFIFQAYGYYLMFKEYSVSLEKKCGTRWENINGQAIIKSLTQFNTNELEIYIKCYNETDNTVKIYIAINGEKFADITDMADIITGTDSHSAFQFSIKDNDRSNSWNIKPVNLEQKIINAPEITPTDDNEEDEDVIIPDDRLIDSNYISIPGNTSKNDNSSSDAIAKSSTPTSSKSTAVPKSSSKSAKNSKASSTDSDDESYPNVDILMKKNNITATDIVIAVIIVSSVAGFIIHTIHKNKKEN